MFFLVSWFITLIYQPFFNLLVGIYLLLDVATRGNTDMGIAVIIFTIAFRILWIPVSLASGRTIKEKLELSDKIEQLEKDYKYDPVVARNAIKNVFQTNRRIVVVSAFNILLQTLIALMLWRIFARGLEGEDFHLLYPFMPEITEPFNLTFMGKYDLTHTNWTLNFIQSLAIFVYEALSALFAVRIASREVVMAQLVLPVISFIVFMGMPAGKKLFIITTLIFSIIQMTVQQIHFWIKSMGPKLEIMANKAAGIEPEKPEIAQVPPPPPEPSTSG